MGKSLATEQCLIAKHFSFGRGLTSRMARAAEKHFGASLTVKVNVTLKRFETDDPKPTKESKLARKQATK